MKKFVYVFLIVSFGLFSILDAAKDYELQDYDLDDYMQDFVKNYRGSVGNTKNSNLSKINNPNNIDSGSLDSTTQKNLILYPNRREIKDIDLDSLQDDDLLLGSPPIDDTYKKKDDKVQYRDLYKYPTSDDWRNNIPYIRGIGR